MPQFIVGHVDWYDHNLVLEKIEAPTWREAWMKHSKNPFEGVQDINPSIEEAKQECFNQDCMMGHIEL